MNILHLTFDMRIGGTEQVIKNLILGADASRFTMSVLCIESPLGPFADDLINSGIHIEALNRKPGFDVSLITQIRQHIKTHKIDIIHCHQYTPYVYGVLSALMTSAKVIFTEHGRFYPDSTTWKRKLINPLLHRFTHATTAISAATRDALVEFEYIPFNDIDVIYNGIIGLEPDNKRLEELKQRYPIAEKSTLFGTIARLDPIKNHCMMLRAFKRVIDAGVDAKLMIVGDGDERSNVDALIDELSLSEHVIMTGYEPKPHAHLALMDIYLLPSLSEGTSMTLLEAMSLRKPCIVTHAGGNPEIVLDKETGLVTPNDDEQAYADAMIMLAQNRQLQEHFGQASRARFEDTFDINNMTQAYEVLYLRLLSGAQV
ncbi:N-acetyl-alpha-D-glucosaminyl L-malate synthase [Paraglaciecola mesophila]|uniref:N-acetyl-alpha-D-glucosaminyl L-malate synthase n=1 Tax=Paraglaciecola mesophila TaxID=197222 RepID=A0A857JJF2_9ALTE|nr:glycosyltransferase [Paraglaciecola mesophila]QHJ11280.1 N-acetyl-alpha-D-glucosaminyl L-malate synthase [Paraglaciecola mesophila]